MDRLDMLKHEYVAIALIYGIGSEEERHSFDLLKETIDKR